MTSVLTAFLQHFTYFALVAILIAAGLGVPVPEDIPLITAGYLTNKQHSPIGMIDTDNDGRPDTVDATRQKRVPNMYLMIVAGMIGVLAGDSVVFYIGRQGIDSNNFVAKHLRKVLHSKRRARAERHFARHGHLTVFAGRFMPGFRSLVFAMAGMAKMSYPRFLAIDGMAAAISVPTFIILGHTLANHFPPEVIYAKVDAVKHIVGPIMLVLTIGAISLYIVRRRRRKAEELAAELAAASAILAEPPPKRNGNPVNLSALAAPMASQSSHP